ncbi:hypothetical protein ACSBR2_041901 [Camellia fascicularis]
MKFHAQHEGRSRAYILSVFTSAPTRLLTRGAALPSVSANLANHHLIKPPDNISGNGDSPATSPRTHTTVLRNESDGATRRASSQPSSVAFRYD